jgi:hypothetical protein
MHLTFHNSTTSPIPLSDITLSLSHQSEQLTECHLTGHIYSDHYQQIDRHTLFNLKPELRSTTTLEFAPNFPITLQATLKPDRLPDLTAHTTPESAAQYLLQLSQTTLSHPLLHTENWLALSVSQQQDQTQIGYTTLWKTLNPAAIANFLTEIGDLFNDLADTSLNAIAQLNSPDSILVTLLQFFTDDDWQFTKLQSEPVLQMAFQGNHGKWFCYAKAREEQQQFIFYSLCPIAAPADQKNAIAQFLTLANYGMTIGNFELDYTDGEIRYKTSIDVEGDRLTPALIKRLVYTNVMMMDEYLPGIQAVLAGQAPELAIQAIEQQI